MRKRCYWQNPKSNDSHIYEVDGFGENEKDCLLELNLVLKRKLLKTYLAGWRVTHLNRYYNIWVSILTKIGDLII
jgi:hypothetical protein